MAAVALALTLSFLALVTTLVQRGEAVRCACFGSLTGGEVTWVTVLRHALLVVAALVALLAGTRGHGVVGTLTSMSTADWAWLAAVAFAAVLAVAVGLRQEVVGSYERTPIPDATLVRLDGSEVTLKELAEDQAQLVLFLSPGCGPCMEVAQLVPTWSPQIWPVGVQVVLHDPGVLTEYPFIEPVALFTDDEDSAPRSLDVTMTPSAALLGTDGLLAAGPLAGLEAITALVDEIRTRTHA